MEELTPSPRATKPGSCISIQWPPSQNQGQVELLSTSYLVSADFGDGVAASSNRVRFDHMLSM